MSLELLQAQELNVSGVFSNSHHLQSLFSCRNVSQHFKENSHEIAVEVDFTRHRVMHLRVVIKEIKVLTMMVGGKVV